MPPWVACVIGISDSNLLGSCSSLHKWVGQDVLALGSDVGWGLEWGGGALQMHVA